LVCTIIITAVCEALMTAERRIVEKRALSESNRKARKRQNTQEVSDLGWRRKTAEYILRSAE
jgi:hypothetical protein